MSIENKKITDEELDNVTGGCKETRWFQGNKGNYSAYNIPVDKYCGEIGKKYLFVSHNNSNDWLFGVLVNTYEANNGAYTYRTHDIKVEDGNNGDGVESTNHYIRVDEDYGTREVCGDDYQMYTKA